MTDTVHDVAIIGSGPAGYTAALYAARAELKPIVFEGYEYGGELMNTTDVENFPGFPEGILGPDLMQKMQEQAERFGAEIVYDDVTAVELSGEVKRVTTAYSGDVEPLDEHRARARRDQPVDHARECRLARPVRADDARPARVEDEVDAAEHDAVAVGVVDVAELDHRCRPAPSRSPGTHPAALTAVDPPTPRAGGWATPGGRRRRRPWRPPP